MALPIVGILGTGHLASYTVAGIRNNSDQRQIILSPRNAKVAASISHQYNCEIADCNQDLIDRSDIILLAVRPHQLDGLLTNLIFKPTQLIISAMAGISITKLGTFPNLRNHTIVRTLPSASAEVNVGAVPVYPFNKRANELLSNLGTLVILKTEAEFEIATVHGCLHGWLYFWLDELVKWTHDQGISEQQSLIMIKQTVAGALALSEHKKTTLSEIGHSIATPGTYTLAGLEQLKTDEALDNWGDAMQLVKDKLNSD